MTYPLYSSKNYLLMKRVLHNKINNIAIENIYDTGDE